jgi:hypothetical protein
VTETNRNEANVKITDTPWDGRCWTTGLTMREFEDRLAGVPAHVPEFAVLASVRICRAYGINGQCDPGYIANVIAEEVVKAARPLGRG